MNTILFKIIKYIVIVLIICLLMSYILKNDPDKKIKISITVITIILVSALFDIDVFNKEHFDNVGSPNNTPLNFNFTVNDLLEIVYYIKSALYDEKVANIVNSSVSILYASDSNLGIYVVKIIEYIKMNPNNVESQILQNVDVFNINIATMPDMKMPDKIIPCKLENVNLNINTNVFGKLLTKYSPNSIVKFPSSITTSNLTTQNLTNSSLNPTNSHLNQPESVNTTNSCSDSTIKVIKKLIDEGHIKLNSNKEDYNDMRYNQANINQLLPMATYDKNYNNKWDNDYAILNTDKWAPPRADVPICKTEKTCEVCPNLTKGYPVNLKDFNYASKVLPPDNINIEYIKDRLNRTPNL